MSKPSDPRSDGARPRGSRLALISAFAVVGVTGLVLQWPLGAKAGYAAGDGARGLPPPPPAASTKAPAAASTKAGGAYQLRCWQYGRLLFDEGPVTLNADARRSATLVATDRHGAPLIVTESGGTTCLARPYPAPRNPALPR